MITKSNPSFFKRFIAGEAHYGFWNVVGKGFAAVNTFLIISSLTIYQYGVFQLLMSLYGVFADTISIGGGVVNNDISRSIAVGNEGRAKRLFREYAYTRFFLNLIFFVLFFWGGELFGERYTEEFLAEIRIVAFLFLTEFLVSLFKSLLSIRLQFKIVAARSTVYKVVQLVVLAGFFFWGDIGIGSLLLSMVIASLVSIVMMLRPFLRELRAWKGVTEDSNAGLFKTLLTYGKWDIFRQMGTKLTSRLQPWLIKLFISTEAVAIFSIANSMIALLKDSLPSKTLMSLVPMSLDDQTASQRRFSYGVKFAGLWGIIVALGGLIVAPPLIRLFFTSYVPSLSYFYLMLASIPFWGVTVIISIYLVALREQRYLFMQTTFKNIFSTLVYVILLPFVGLWGLALERVMTPIVMVYVTHRHLKRGKSGISFHLRDLVDWSRKDMLFLKGIWVEFFSMIRFKMRRREDV